MATKVVEVKTLKVGKYVVLNDEPCKIVGLSTSSPGKHGAAKARVEAIGVFDGQKRNQSPSQAKRHVLPYPLQQLPQKNKSVWLCYENPEW